MKFIKDYFKFMAFMFKMIFKIFKLALVVTGIITIVRCGSGFTKKGDKVYYNGEEVGEDFVVLNDEFAKDDSTVYYKMYGIPGADVSSFQAISKHYGKDLRSVFYCDEYRDGQTYFTTKNKKIINIKNADPATFEMVGDTYSGYARDKYSGYFNGESFDVAYPATLTLIGGSLLKDKLHVYYKQVPITGSDPASFQKIDNYYFKDKNKVYTLSNDSKVVALPCDLTSFVVLEFPYSKDAKRIFYKDQAINVSGVNSFKIIGNNYSKDGQSVFFKENKIEGADLKTFQVDSGYINTTGESYYARDKVHVYWQNKLFRIADAATFIALDHGYTKDKNYVYYDRKIVLQADPASFTVYEHMMGEADAEDIKGKYGLGKKL